MDDLVAFLRARLNEDEAAAKRNAAAWDEAEDWVRYEWDDVPDSIAELYGRFGSARVLREVEAKRRILAEHHPVADQCPVGGGRVSADEPCVTLRALAAVWSDHPDYRPEWTP